MKLKYFMRGLGLGIVLTTLIITISNPKQKLTDDQIKNRAEKLGMVMKDEKSSNLDKALKDMDLSTTPKPSDSVKPTKIPTPEPTVKPTMEPTKAPKDDSSSSKDTSKDTSKDSDKKQKDQSDKVMVTIRSGMSSSQVAKLLVSKGLIEDAQAFNHYLVNLNKSGLIRVGKFSVSKDANYDDIIDIITYDKKK